MTSSIVETLRSCSDFGKSIEKWNFYTYRDPQYRWDVARNKLSNVLFEYCNFVANAPDIWTGSAGSPSLAWKNNDDMPTVFPFTFMFPSTKHMDEKRSDRKEPYYDDSLIHALIYHLQTTMQDLVEPEDYKTFYVTVLESSDYWSIVESGEHYHCVCLVLHMVWCVLPSRRQETDIRSAFVRSLHKHNVMKYFSVQPKGDWDSIIGKETVSSPFLFYGSSVSREIIPPKFRGVVDVLGAPEADGIEFIDEKEVYGDLFDYRRHEYCTKGFVPHDMFTSSGNSELWLPLYLSPGYHTSIIHLKSTERKDKVDEKKMPRNNNVEIIDAAMGNVAEVAQKLLDLIAPEVIGETYKWMDIGKCLYSIFKGSDVGRQKWIDFTAKYKDPARNHGCEMFYSGLGHQNYLTIRTLAYYAKTSDCEGYRKWHEEWIFAACDRIASILDHNQVAIVVYRTFWFNFIYAPKGKKSSGRGESYTWWHFNESSTWVEDEAALVELQKDIIDKLGGPLSEYVKLQYNKNLAIEDRGRRAFEDQRIKVFTEIKVKLNDLTYVNKIIRLARLRFVSHINIPLIMDSNPNLTAHKNCVMEVQEEEFKLKHEKFLKCRPKKAEDYLSMSTGVWYNEFYKDASPDVVTVKNYLEKLHSNKEIREFAIEWDASCYQAGNRDKNFIVRIGPTNTGKSGDNRLKRTAWGDYYKECSTKLFTGDSAQSGGANDEEARLMNSRVANAFEPGSTEIIRTEKVKAFTGRDPKYIRGLYTQGQGIEQTYKMSMYTNSELQVTEVDPAIVTRMIILRYETTWSPNAPQDEKEQVLRKHYPSDRDFDTKIDRMGPAYSWILAQAFETYKARKHLHVPEIIKKQTVDYWEHCDPYRIFIRRLILREVMPDGQPNATFSIHTNEMWEEFKKWFLSFGYPKNSLPNGQKMLEHMELRLGKTMQSRWWGYRLNKGHIRPQQQVGPPQPQQNNGLGLQPR